MAGTTYDPNDPSTWGPIIGTTSTGAPIYANQPGATAGNQAAASGGGGGTTTGALEAAATGGIYGNGTAQKTAGILSGYTPVAGILGAFGLGGGDSGAAAAQTALAQNTVVPSNTESMDVYNRAIAQSNMANAITAPSAVVSTGQTAQQLNAGAYNVNTDTTAKTVNATPLQQAYQADQAQASAAAVQNLNKANVANVAAVPGADVAHVNTTVEAPTIGQAAQTGGTTVGGTTLASQSGMQDAEVAAANNIANGPSAAMSQFQAGQSQITRDQLAMAAASRGSDRAGARREAMLNVGASGAQNNLSAAALAAQETQAKNVAASSALQGVGSQALTAATTQASLTSQQQQLQAQIDAATAQGNTAAVNTLRQTQAQLQLSAGQSSVTAGLAQQGTLANNAEYNTGLQQQTAVANANAANTANTAYSAASNNAYSNLAQSQSSIAAQNAAATTAASAANAGAYNTAQNQFAAASNQANLANAALTQSQAQADAQRAAAIDTSNAASVNQFNLANATNSIGAQTTNAANQLNATQLQQQSAIAALNAGNTAVGNETKNAQTVVDANKSAAAATAQQQGAIIGAAGSVLGKLSDERAKVDIASVGGNSSYADKYGQMLSDAYGNTATASPYGTALSDERTKREVDRMGMEGVANFTRKAPAVTFRYKPGIEDGGAAYKAGTLAQGVEAAGPLGRMFVDERPDGLKEVQYGPMAHFEAKGAQATADRALAVASAAYRRAR